MLSFFTGVLPHVCILCYKITTASYDLCPACRDDLPLLNTTHALYAYQPPITNLILNLKFNHALVNARMLGEQLAIAIQDNWYCNKPLPEVIIPVPLHPKRLQERGFNQALEIAKPISKKIRRPLDYTSCIRIKHTDPQATLHANDRHRNVKNAFQIIRELSYRHVAVLDDVITTGYTMAELCHVLKQAGVSQVDVWCCARPLLRV